MCKFSCWVFCLLFVSIDVISGATTTSQTITDSEEEEVPSTHVPKFLSPAQSLSVLEGETVTFHCEVDDVGTFTTVWRKGAKDVLFANNLRVQGDKHIQRLNDRSLQLRQVRPSDSGQYYCIISSNPIVEILHTLTVIVPPRITSVMKNQLTLRKGQPLNLNCEASGTPPPTIYWKLQDGFFSTGKNVHNGSVLYTAQATRHQAGTYECIADNGAGTPATHVVKVHVIYPPELEAVRSWVHAGEETSAELTCKVNAHPTAAVTWQTSDGTLISESEHFRLKSMGGEHSLQIRRMRKGDFGDYQCKAVNDEGMAVATITVSGLASAAEFKSDPHGDQPNSYVLKWVTHSHSTVIDYLLKIRKKSEEDGDWTEIQVPADSQQGLLKTQSHEVTGLEVASAYEAEVTVQNKFGNSQPSKRFVFYTQGAFERQTKDEDKDGKNSGPTIPSSKKLSSLMTVIILSVFFWF